MLGNKKYKLLTVSEKAEKSGLQNHPEWPSQPLAVHLAWGREMTSRQESKRYLCLTVAGSG